MNEKTIVHSTEWPYNLLNAMEIDEDPLDHLDDIGTLEVAMAISSLTPREKSVIRMRYAQEMTLKEVGVEIGVKQERVRQIEGKALRKLRFAKGSGYVIRNGVKAYIHMRILEGVEQAAKAKEAELEGIYREKLASVGCEMTQNEQKVWGRILSLTVEEMDLSVRAYNCLKRSGNDTVQDIVTRYPDYESAMQIRNLGRKSLEEVSEKLRSYGIRWPKESAAE